MPGQLKCTNKGCGKLFSEDENGDTSCEYHPGAPVFHEGLKSWSCCNSRKVTDFDEFLQIPGCKLGKHTHVAAEPKEKPQQASAQATITPTATTNGVETYGTTNEFTTPTSSPTLPAPSGPQTTQEAPAKPEAPKEDTLNDPMDAVITPGTKCRRKGCNATFVDSKSREEKCIFHPGEPIFHEGSKGWTCCPRRVLEFDEFLKIQGCKTGIHRFLESEHEKETMVQCRTDWYQTPNTVHISIFAKKASKTETTVTFTPSSVRAVVILPNGKKSIYETLLSQPIVPEESSFEVLGTKVEITMKKANGISWASIEPNSSIKSWTTYGVTGSVGTIGAKEAILAVDSPLYAMK